MNPTRTFCTSTIPPTLSRAVCRGLASQSSRTALRAVYPLGLNAQRQFSTSRRSNIEFFPPAKDTPNIKETRAAWPHPKISEQQLQSIEPFVHRDCQTWSDKVAYGMVKTARWWMDLFSGYRHDETKPYQMTPRKWFVRFIFLETIAAVPGMTAGMLRHFRSLRRMQRDNGWIETMLEDAYNERMHLLTFMKMAEPGWFMKMMIIGAQGVFSNAFFLAYLASPATCHRFVGYLEEEATNTYTLAVQDLDKGHLPEWENLEAPEIAVKYWNMPEGHRTMRDLLLYVRADEAKHREIHHTFGNLDQVHDPNPFVSEYKDKNKPHPSNGWEHLKSQGWERKDII
ncbi:inducible alternative oxidase 2 [Knufia obscura]|uniref:Alternative oxidase n=2 Tax=Knufia TaxID=430999 RepID=A0AAN8I2Q9_9EURO|nr:inducible alternative oxidase 2 [Knufia obscura]KAK5949159.1 inducible alternative oxidase 2 [Knufia fluminis]